MKLMEEVRRRIEHGICVLLRTPHICAHCDNSCSSELKRLCCQFLKPKRS